MKREGEGEEEIRRIFLIFRSEALSVPTSLIGFCVFDRGVYAQQYSLSLQVDSLHQRTAVLHLTILGGEAGLRLLCFVVVSTAMDGDVMERFCMRERERERERQRGKGNCRRLKRGVVKAKVSEYGCTLRCKLANCDDDKKMITAKI